MLRQALPLICLASRRSDEPMDTAEKSQSSADDEKDAPEDDILGCMEIDDAEDMNEVAHILLHLNVSDPHTHPESTSTGQPAIPIRAIFDPFFYTE